MPSLKDHQSAQTTKMLFIGDSGSGKSGALASLAAAGYNLRILDLDNGLDVLFNFLKSTRYDAKGMEHVVYETITDPMKMIGGKVVPKSATVWQKAIKMLEHWKTATEDLGPITTWTSQDVLVVDSLTMLSNAAMNFILSLNGRLTGRPEQSDWYQGQQLIEGLLQMLYDDNVKCNVIISAHITYVGAEGDPMKRGYPNTLGRALPPKVGRYFNNILLARTSGYGQNEKREILTNKVSVIELKNSAPTFVKEKYPLETGLADFFRDLRAGVPPK